jgi:hypothetical protein
MYRKSHFGENKKQIVGLSPIYDYIYRPSELKHMNLYEWTLRCQRQKYNPRASRKKDVDDLGDDEDNKYCCCQCIL